MTLPAITDTSRAYEPFGAALAILNDKRPEVLIAGPSGTGKSLACLYKLAILADGCPGMRALIVRKTRASCTESVLVSFEDQVLPPGSPILQGASRENRHVYRFPNGSEIVVGGMDNPDRIMSTEYDVIYVAEATELSEEDWEKLSTRLGRHNRVPYQQMLGDTNPGAPTHWLKQRCDRGDCIMFESRHKDNPLLWHQHRKDWTRVGAEYLARLDRLTGVRKERLRFGRWVSAEGVVYEGWDARAHLIDRFEVPDSWRRVRAIDFGYQNPFVCLWIAMDEDGRMFVYRYIYRTQTLVEDHAKRIKFLTKRETIEATVADHDAEDRATLRRHGIVTRPAKKEIKLGIEAMARRLRVEDDGRSRLFVMRDSLASGADESLIDSGRPWTVEQEFEVYRWPKSSEGKPVKENPVDTDNHAMDALRYAVRYVDGGAASMDAGPIVIRPASRRSLLRAV